MQYFRAFQIGLFGIGLYLSGVVLEEFGFIQSMVGNLLGLASFGLAIVALIKGKNELNENPKDRKAKIGFILGAIVVSVQLFVFFLIILLTIT
ncbi:MAG: hypothetical protein HY818_17690 [Acetobacterium woodii]|nr:hypothetical protein [Acetobacterium woodii]